MILLLLLLLIASPAEAYLFASGSYTGDGTDSREIVISATTSPSVTSFQPDVVFIKCDSATNMAWSTRSITAFYGGDAGFFFNVTGGAQANLVQGWSANGFQIGSDAGVNGTGVSCYYTALASVAGDIAVGTYTTNGTDNRTIDISDTSLGPVADFSPEFVLVQRDSGTTTGVWRTTGMTGDFSCFSNLTSCATNDIQSFSANGFVIGSATAVNGGVVPAFYVAIAAVSGSSNAGTYTGNGVDNRQITTPAFRPEFMWIKGHSSSRLMAVRFKDEAGDAAMAIDGFSATDRIQQFLSNGFEVGTALTVNENATAMYYYALKAVPTGVAAPVRHRPVVIQ